MTSDRVSDERLADFTTPSSQTRGPTMQECIDMARELQHLRSPVTVSDEMARATAVNEIVEWHSGFAAHEERLAAECLKTGFATDAEIHAVKAKLHRHSAGFISSLTAALVPAEQEGESLRDRLAVIADERADMMPGEYPEEQPTSGGDNRVVAEIDVLLDNCHWVEDIDIAAQHESVKFLVKQLASSLQDVEREAWNKGYAARDGVVNACRTRAETAEASLAAAREALKPFAAYADAVSGRHDYFIEVGWMGSRESDGEPAEVNLIAADFRVARAALAGSNGNG